MTTQQKIEKIVNSVEDWDLEILEQFAKDTVRENLEKMTTQQVDKEYKLLTN